MNAVLLLNERHALTEDVFVELVVWRLPSPVDGSSHSYKYRLALIANGCCVLRYDNERGKGDHRHMGERQTPYFFTSPQALLADFWRDVDDWRS